MSGGGCSNSGWHNNSGARAVNAYGNNSADMGTNALISMDTKMAATVAGALIEAPIPELIRALT